jgi:hypothetical protein
MYLIDAHFSIDSDTFNNDAMDMVKHSTNPINDVCDDDEDDCGCW